jgi:molecular chaperone DnaK (HSP70)
MASIAIDFGTSNCSAHIVRSDGVLEPVHLDGQNFHATVCGFYTKTSSCSTTD